jgi:hypothetical protein
VYARDFFPVLHVTGYAFGAMNMSFPAGRGSLFTPNSVRRIYASATSRIKSGFYNRCAETGFKAASPTRVLNIKNYSRTVAQGIHRKEIMNRTTAKCIEFKKL